jgi:chromosome segregation ATPase
MTEDTPETLTDYDLVAKSQYWFNRVVESLADHVRRNEELAAEISLKNKGLDHKEALINELRSRNAELEEVRAADNWQIGDLTRRNEELEREEWDCHEAKRRLWNLEIETDELQARVEHLSSALREIARLYSDEAGAGVVMGEIALEALANLDQTGGT